MKYNSFLYRKKEYLSHGKEPRFPVYGRKWLSHKKAREFEAYHRVFTGRAGTDVYCIEEENPVPGVTPGFLQYPACRDAQADGNRKHRTGGYPADVRQKSPGILRPPVILPISAATSL